MKTLLCLFALALLGPTSAFAGTFTLVDNASQETYTCTSGGDNGGGEEGFDCIERLQKVCGKEFTSGCYESARKNCENKSRTYGRCVESTYNACRKEFTSGCYESARKNCK